MYTCAYCGTVDESVSTHSGTQECRKCWIFRKLDRPAATHWARVTSEFFSNTDMYDMMTYLPDTVGLTRGQINVMLDSVFLLYHTSRFLNEHGPKHRWTDEVKEEFEELTGKVREVLQNREL